MKGDHQNENATGNESRTKQALRASELSYRRLFEAAKDGILILDVDTGRINDVNPFLFKLCGGHPSFPAAGLHSGHTHAAAAAPTWLDWTRCP